MKDISQVTAMVVDKGLFLPMARRLAEKCQRVIYYNPERHQFPSTHQGCIGDGFPDIEHSDTLWKKKGEVDFFVFPDIGMADEQNELRSQGFPVWGSGDTDRLEQNREYFMDVLSKTGLEVPPHIVIEGLEKLAEHLRDKEDKIIKVSKWRGDTETQKWRSWKLDRAWIYEQALRYGPVGDHIRFMVCDVIETPLEIGGDTYHVLGNWPATMLQGLEFKDTTYISAVTKTEDMPEQAKEVLEAMAPHLAGAITQWSMEIRVKDGKGYFIDPTPRGGMPSSASQQLCWKNFPEIIWFGAHGELIDPDPDGKFTIECAVTSKSHEDSTTVVELPPGLERNVRFSNCYFEDGCYCFPPNPNMSGILGWLCVVGDTPKETLEMAKALADLLPDGLDANVENMVGLIKEVDEAEQQDIPFTEEPMPTPAQVVED